MAKSYADWQAKAKQLGWSPGQYSLAAYKGTPHYAQGGSTAAAAPAAAPAATPKPVFEVDGATYPQGTSRKIFGNNPNKGYAQQVTQVGGKQNTYNVKPGAVGGRNLYMTKDGRRALYTNTGTPYYEESPGSGRFTPYGKKYNGGNFIQVEDYNANPPAPPPAPAPAPAPSSSGIKAAPVNTAPVGGGPTSSAPVNTQISATQQALNAAVAAINAQAIGYSTQMQNLTQAFNAANATPPAAPVWPGAPSWVKSFDDYKKWKRQQSAETGYLSTINTTPTGLTTEQMDNNVTVTALTG